MKYGKLRQEGYISRLTDQSLARMLDLFGAVEVAGTMWCGKTWTSLAYAESATRVGQAAVRTLAEADPGTVLIGDQPHVIDEWQDVPAIWDEVRAAIDLSGSKAGQYILTGSSRPHKAEVYHSGAGRIGSIRMRTMSLFETGESTGRVSLAGLFAHEFQAVPVQQTLPPLAEMICRGGWPALIQRQATAADASAFLDSYFDALFAVSMEKRGLNGEETRRVALSLARNMGSAVKLATVANDAQFSDITDKAAAAKAAAHIAALEAFYVIEGIRGWDAPVRARSRLRAKPKYYFADPSLAAALLQITPERLVADGQLFGVLFESLCMHDLAVYASVLPGAQREPLHYYRDSDGLEVDAVVELRDGRWGAFEIKLGENKTKEAAASLHRLANKIAANPAARNPQPEFLAVLVGAGEFARRDRENGVYIIPITALGA